MGNDDGGEEPLVPWHEVVRDDRLRSNDTAMRAELEALRMRLDLEREARQHFFRHRMSNDFTRVQRRMAILSKRSAFQAWTAEIPSRQGTASKPDMAAERVHVLIAELRGLVGELHGESQRVSPPRERSQARRLKDELQGLIDEYIHDSELAVKAGVTSPSEDAAYLRGFRFVISSFQMMLTASTSPEEEAACEQLQAQDTHNPLVPTLCSSILALKAASPLFSRGSGHTSATTPPPYASSPSPVHARGTRSVSGSPRPPQPGLEKEVSGLFLDVCTLEENNAELTKGLSEALEALSLLGRPNKRLEGLLPLGTPLWRRKPSPSPDKSRGGISIAETLDELERSQDAEFERPREGGVAVARQQGGGQSEDIAKAERVEDDLPAVSSSSSGASGGEDSAAASPTKGISPRKKLKSSANRQQQSKDSNGLRQQGSSRRTASPPARGSVRSRRGASPLRSDRRKERGQVQQGPAAFQFMMPETEAAHRKDDDGAHLRGDEGAHRDLVEGAHHTLEGNQSLEQQHRHHITSEVVYVRGQWGMGGGGNDTNDGVAGDQWDMGVGVHMERQHHGVHGSVGHDRGVGVHHGRQHHGVGADSSPSALVRGEVSRRGSNLPTVPPDAQQHRDEGGREHSPLGGMGGFPPAGGGTWLDPAGEMDDLSWLHRVKQQFEATRSRSSAVRGAV